MKKLIGKHYPSSLEMEECWWWFKRQISRTNEISYKTWLILLFCYFAPRRGAKYFNEFVCLSVWLSVRI